jgi:hypothetical protein
MGEQYAPPPGQQQRASGSQQHVQWPGQGRSGSELASNNPFRSAHPFSSQAQRPPANFNGSPPAYQPPPDPPPNWQDDKKQRLDQNEEYAPPPGPPPSHTASEPEPPPYDPWLAVPDNALLPPPPAIREERSPAANASYDDAARGHAWCRQNPIWPAQRHTQQSLSQISMGDVKLTTPPNTKDVTISPSGRGKTQIRTTKSCGDTIMLSDLPLYTPSTSLPRTIYFELKVLSMGKSGKDDAGIALGFVAPPYPSWRFPGWHRASLGVHGDDGRRYIDNSEGGRDFVNAFRKNDVVGIGMTFSPPVYQGQKNRVEVFFMRNGKKEGGWDLHEDRDLDSEYGDVYGLEGEHDLLAAVGCFGAVVFEVKFRREDWAFKF